MNSGFVGDRAELLNVACDPTRELWRDLNAAFREHRAREGAPPVAVRMSHGGSGSQARSVIDGLPADVLSLALFTDTDAVRKAGLIAPGWDKQVPDRSLPYVSTIVFVVRKGNPKGIKDWPDLVERDVTVVTPSPKTSGNGKWSFLALWGSQVWTGKSEDAARDYVTKVYRRVPVLDTAARAATLRFAHQGAGDVHLTWENEAHLEVAESKGELEIVYPPVSVRAEPHVAVVDATVDRKGTRAAAEAYIDFLYTEEAQERIAKHYHRPNAKGMLEKFNKKPDGSVLFPDIRVESALTLMPEGQRDWDAVQRKFFAEGGEFDGMQAGNR